MMMILMKFLISLNKCQKRKIVKANKLIKRKY